MAEIDVPVTFRVIRHPPPCHRCRQAEEQHRPLDAAAACRGYIHPESVMADVLDLRRALHRIVWAGFAPRRWR